MADSTLHVTKKSFFATHLAVVTTVVIAGITGAVAWGQTEEKVGNMEDRQGKLEVSIEEVQRQTQKNTGLLERLDERSKAQDAAQRRQDQVQQRILNSIESLSRDVRGRE